MSIRVTKENSNTPEFWDSTYRSESHLGQDRLFGPRLDNVIRWVRICSLKLALGTPMSFLDVGCGLGDLAKRVCWEFPTAIPAGVDISQVAIEYAKGKFPAGRFEVADAAKLPFNHAQFDFVWCGETLEHVNDADQVVFEISRVIKPGGIVVLSTPYKNTIGGPEHVWSHSTSDMLRWHKILGGELIFLSYNIVDDMISQMMMMAVRTEEFM